MRRGQQPWKCLRGHANDVELSRCGMCGLPRWLTWWVVVVVVVAVLVGVGYGGYSLSGFLKQWQYQERVREAWSDGQITASERQSLDAEKAYLGLTDQVAREWEEAVTGTRSPPREPVVRPAISEALEGVRTQLEEGQLGAAREAIASLAAAHPGDAEVLRLKDEMERRIAGRVEVRVAGPASGQHVLDASATLMVLSGRESGYRIFFEPHEPSYFYAFAETSGGRVRVLAPAAGGPAEPLAPGESYFFPPTPARPPYFPLEDGRDPVSKVVMVSSRWPALDLEHWAANLASDWPQEAARGLREALAARAAAGVGGCDVRTMRFDRGGR